MDHLTTHIICSLSMANYLWQLPQRYNFPKYQSNIAQGEVAKYTDTLTTFKFAGQNFVFHPQILESVT